MPEPKNIHDQARLARAERLAPDGVMSAKMEGGKMVVGPSTRPAGMEPTGDNVSLLPQQFGREYTDSELNEKAEELGYSDEMTVTELEERTAALTALISAKIAWERDQIVKSIKSYAYGCDERSDQLLAQGKQARKHLRKNRDKEGGDKALEEGHRRAAAFSVRSAIALDLAEKVASGWGRSVNGEAG